MRKKDKIICGVGINDYDGKVVVDGKKIRSYITWHHMIQRCYDKKNTRKTKEHII